METIKNHTSIEQSRKLAEILPIESADMYFEKGIGDNYKAEFGNYVDMRITENMLGIKTIPCWSLAALLSVLPYNVSFNKAVYRFKMVKFTNHWECYHENFGRVSTEIFKADNPIDCCVEMIEKLHELKMM